MVNFVARSRPAMTFQQEGFQRGPKHSGKAEITVRAYAWTQEMIDDYITMRKKEDFDLLGTIDASLKEAMNSLGDEMKSYLVEAGEKLFEDDAAQKKKEDEKKAKAMLDKGPFIALFEGFGDLGKALFGGINLFKIQSSGSGAPNSAVVKDSKNGCWRAFKNYRKAHKILTY